MKKKDKVGILDYGTGNIASIFQALKTIGANPLLITQKNQIKDVSCIILPGIGHFGEALKYLRNRSLFDTISIINETKIPTLGICLGFQLLTKSSEESPNDVGFGILPLKTKRIRPIDKINFKVPHIGWNSINSSNNNTYLLKNIKFKNQIFFYSNAYGVEYDKNHNLTQAGYSHEKEWIAIVEYQNIFGVQFHPEKSRMQGLNLLNNFISFSEKS